MRVLHYFEYVNLTLDSFSVCNVLYFVFLENLDGDLSFRNLMLTNFNLAKGALADGPAQNVAANDTLMLLRVHLCALAILGLTAQHFLPAWLMHLRLIAALVELRLIDHVDIIMVSLNVDFSLFQTLLGHSNFYLLLVF